ncbi:MAG: universal stress protein [Gammaproteobacteria bacterium]
MSKQTLFERVLVILNADQITFEAPLNSPAIKRALDLAKTMGCEIELFHVVHDTSSEQHLFSAYSKFEEDKKQVMNRNRKRMADMALELASKGVTVLHDVRWDSSRTEAILRKIEDAGPDLVVKQSREHSYLPGLTAIRTGSWFAANRFTCGLFRTNTWS